MHPVIKVCSFLVVALFLTRAGAAGVGATLAGLLAMRAAGVGFDLAGIRTMLRRMRWLLFSVLVIYLWFTPGIPLIPPLGHYSPTEQGMLTGLLRVVTLALIAVLVVLLQSMSRSELIGAIHWLASPLRHLGLDSSRMALRITLILECVDEIQPLLRQQMEGLSRSGDRLARTGRALALLFQAVIERAEGMQQRRVHVTALHAPPRRQWLYPFALLLLFGILLR